MNKKAIIYGPEVPNYAVLNAQNEQQQQRASKPRKVKSSKKTSVSTGDDQPK